MKTFLHLLKRLFTMLAFACRAAAVIFAVLFCYSISLHAAGKRVSGGKGHRAVKNGQVKAKNLFAYPLINYGSPQVYSINSTIAPLAPINTGSAVAAPSYANGLATFVAGLQHPRGIACDRLGNIYIADLAAFAISKFPPGGGAPVIIGSNIVEPVGVAVDYAGNVYVAAYNQNNIVKIPVGGGPQTIIGTGYSNIIGLAADAAGNVFVPDYGTGKIYKIPAGGGSQSIIATGFTHPSGVAADSLGNVYVCDFGTSLITKIPPGGAPHVNIGTGILNPYGLTVDASGNVFVADFGNHAVAEIPAGSNTRVNINSAFITLTGVVTNGEGTIYTTDYDNTTVLKINPVGGYYINKPLPPGLSLDKTTGIISGTPTVASPATDYVVTAYNADGNSSTTVNITISPFSNNANLAALTLSAATLTPAFDANTTSYTATVNSSISSIKITPTTNQAGATIKVKGVATPSGTASASVAVAIGTTAIPVVVTAGTGTVTKTYTITVTRTGSTNASLSALTLSSGTLSPAYTAGVINYTATVSNSTSEITITPTAGNPAATILVNGKDATSGLPSGTIALNAGVNIITTAVTAQDGTTKKTYTVKVTRAASENAGLSSLTVSTGTLSPAFNTATTAYTISVANAINSIKITPATSVANATVKINGTAVASGSASGTIPLVPGANVINTVVTAPNGLSTQTYTVTVTRAGSTNATLSALTLNSGTLSPAFAAGVYTYTASVSGATSSITLTPTAGNPAATIKVNGMVVASGTVSAAIPLVGGPNVINTVVTAQDGITIKTYKLTVTRPGSANAGLVSFTLSAGILSPAFATATLSYATSEANGISSIKITPTASDAGATIKINGTTVVSGMASANVPIAVGTTNVSTVVTASDGTTTKTYTLTVTRAPSTNATLNMLTLGSGTLTPVFAAGIYSYTASVTNATASIILTPTAGNPAATIKVNGTTVTSGAASGAIALVVGVNTIATTVTAQDGTTFKTYTLKVTRAAPAAMVVAAQEQESPVATGKVTVHPAISPNGDGIEDVLTIDGLDKYQDNTLQIISRGGELVYTVKGYDNVSKVFDGHSSINGKLQQPGTYFYQLAYTDKGKVVNKTGYILLKY